MESLNNDDDNNNNKKPSSKPLSPNSFIRQRYGAVNSDDGMLFCKHKTTPPPPLASTEHLGGSRQYWRDIILGVNDGLVSTFLLVAGVAGGGLSSDDILLTAVAGSLAGAVSMATGEYVATKSQNQVMEGELTLERQHVERYPDDEMDELRSLLPLIGLARDENEDDNGNNNIDHLCQQLLHYYREHPQALLKIMTVLEFGVVDDEVRSPMRAGLFSCVLFVAGSLPSVVPFLCSGHEPLLGLAAAAACTVAALLVVGAVKTWATRGNWGSAAVENLAIAGLGGALAYGTGLLFDAFL